MRKKIHARDVDAECLVCFLEATVYCSKYEYVYTAAGCANHGAIRERADQQVDVFRHSDGAKKLCAMIELGDAVILYDFFCRKARLVSKKRISTGTGDPGARKMS